MKWGYIQKSGYNGASDLKVDWCGVSGDELTEKL